MKLNDIFQSYLQGLQQFNVDEITEHTYRIELHTLLNSIISKSNLKISVQHEPKRTEGFGAPDFKVANQESIIGYIENKKLSEDLNKTLKSAQIKKYTSLSNNIIITNYIEWIWLREGEVIERAKLCEIEQISNKGIALVDLDKAKKIHTLLLNFFSQPPKGISSPKPLAKALAIRGRFLRDFLYIELDRQSNNHTEGRLYGLYDTFKNNVFTELKTKEFADAFSQTLVYGLFLAKLNAKREIITLYNAKQFILPAFGLISELVDFLDELEKREYNNARWIVEEILGVMNTIDLKSITRSLSYSKSKTSNLFHEETTSYKDPYIYFYEHFLAEYDKDLKTKLGVFYTPPQVVNFIVRGLNNILKNVFQIEDGYADTNNVTVLDFATGTGTFLLEILEQVFEDLPVNSGKKNAIIKEHILKNFYGFEYLIAPYTVANLKLSQFLKDNGYELKDDDRFQIYLTNTLEPISSQLNIPLLPTLSRESKAAQHVKDKPILVITGNPPYAGHSKNPSERKVKVTLANGKEVNRTVKTWIGTLMKDYYNINGLPLGERNPKWLQDDYVKFIRFAQWKIDQVDEGVVGIITNHRFISNSTFKGMRHSLMNSFDQIYVLDLHGSNKPKEFAPDGTADDNVFDIEQGVAISFFIKKPGLEKKVFHSDLFGKRQGKYEFCLNTSLEDIDWNEIYPKPPFFHFFETDTRSKEVYDSGIDIKDIFEQDIIGFYTGRDPIAVAFDKKSLQTSITNHFPSLPYQDNYVKECLYRPFDNRFVYYSKPIVNRMRPKVMPSMLFENVALAIGRAGSAVSKEFMWNLAFVSNQIVDLNLFSRGGANVFPLYIYSDSKDTNQTKAFEDPKRANLKSEFLDFINLKYEDQFSNEEIFGYIYAVLNSPNYRAKYRSFLDVHFPRIPFVESQTDFLSLSKLGWEVIDAHLLKTVPSVEKYSIGSFKGNGNNKVTKRQYITELRQEHFGRLYINDNQYFDLVPSTCWKFQIGGYEVLDKYLKDRKDKELTLSEIETIEKIIRVLKFTEDKMHQIDSILTI